VEGIEPDLFEAWLTAGACRRAARKDLARSDFWNGQAQAYSDRAAVLLRWDVGAWKCATAGIAPRDGA
jgi:hypothetical protein